MHPVLFRVGGHAVASYGVALLLAFAVGIALARRRARARGLSPERVLDVSLAILVASLLGARLLWVATHAESFEPPAGRWLDAVNPFHADGRFGLFGLTMMGGVAAAVATAFAGLAWRRLPALAYADVLAPSVLLGEGITRIGCFLNGCCHGVACPWPWGVRFPAGSPAHAVFGDAALHATQLYASGAGFLGFALLASLARRRPPDGAVCFAFLAWLSAARLAVDRFRYYEPEASLAWLGGAPLRVSTLVCAALLAAGLLGLASLAWRGAHSRRSSP